MKVRIDKWLWAARFFKTRQLAKSAIENGKVSFLGKKIKPSKFVNIDDEYSVKQGFYKKIITVIKISDKRSNSLEAQSMYEETAESIKQRLYEIEQQKLLPKDLSSKKPNKKDRRLIVNFVKKTT